MAGLDGSERVVDLYCGVGTFTIPLAEHAAGVVGVEGNPRAARDAEFNIHPAGVSDKARILRMPVSRALETRALGNEADIVVVDPPRLGLEHAVLEGIVVLNPRRIIYVSCDPSTLARDLKRLVQRGYELKRVVPLDLFPQTYHIESVTLMERSSVG
jgi:23S rRNA (uracil1939-C5)-methyltransferase